MTLNDCNMLQSLPQIRLCYRLLLVNYRSAVPICVRHSSPYEMFAVTY